jgi:transposase
MPYITDKTSIDCPFMDRRVKLLPCQREMVLYHHKRGESQRQLAKRFNISRSTIRFIVDPEKLKQNLEARENRGGWRQYYDSEKNNENQRIHRAAKYKILKDVVRKES